MGNKVVYNLDWLKKRIDNEEKIKYLFFWGHSNNHKEEVGKSCFSQWYEAPFEVDGVVYKTSEHWMMAQKAILFNDNEAFINIISCSHPKQAKEFGRQVLNFNNEVWDKYRCDIVRIGNIYKFSQNEKLANYLLTTVDRVIVEASPIDLIWGIGLTKDSVEIENVYSWRGLNLLGFILMEVRDFLKENKSFTDKDQSLTKVWCDL